MTEQTVLRDLARLMQQTAVKQAVQERALHRLLGLLAPDQAAALAAGLREDVQQVRENFGGGSDQPAVDRTITFELTAMLEALGHGGGPR